MNKYTITCITNTDETLKLTVKAKNETAARNNFKKQYKSKRIISIVERPKVKLSLFNEKALLNENIVIPDKLVEIEEALDEKTQITKNKMKKHAESFRKIRKSYKLTLKQLSKEMGINVGVLGKWERAEVIPKEDVKTLEMKIRKACEKLVRVS